MFLHVKLCNNDITFDKKICKIMIDFWELSMASKDARYCINVIQYNIYE